MKRNTWKEYGVAAWSFLLLVVAFSCNKNIENKLEFGSEPKDLGLSANQYKIVYVVVEGAVGTVVGSEATDYGHMPNMAALSMNGVFSWNSVSSEHGTLATDYADLLTGTEIEKHKVSDDQLNGNNLVAYPTLFKRVKQYKGSRTALLTSNSLVPTLIEANSVDNSKVLSTDAEVLSAAKEELSKDEATFVMATFSNVRQVGGQTGYGPDNDKYIQALATFDGQLGEIRKTITNRKNYKNERWLIVVASTNGGKYTLNPALQDGSVFAIPERNNFVLMNNPEFSYKLVERMETVDPAWTGSAVRYSEANGSANLPAAQAALYNLGTGVDAGDYTIQLKLKVNEMNGRNGKAGTAQNGVIFGKQNGAQNFPAGWSITYNGGAGWRFIGNSSTGANYAVDGTAFDLDTWYTLTVKIYKDGANRVVKMYRDGDLKSTNTTFAGRNLSSDSPLKLGYNEGSYGNNGGFVHTIADVRIYKAAIPDDVIKAISCSTMAISTSPFYNDLIGYWPGDDGGAILKDKSKNKRNFELTGSYVWNSFSERGASLCPTLPERMDRYVVRTVDAPLMIYNWMNILEVGQFDLDAQSWSPAFSNN
ncbi:LamG-like jellyroll fold domain-containing protein [Sphingobacterium sp.]|uniref:LamG-like jellyroll fold domain-containing protein n=1 Tax=Sphingobacterium sp. TaxID=341027 RepID=UPI0028AC19FD|nr:LamG-like jellyroll fold domain-containing protein [Sphingobacterium sp.]